MPADARVAEVAARRRGLVDDADLRAAGLTRHAVASRVRRGWLHRRHAGVYSVGHLGDLPLARETAALMACGDRATLVLESSLVVWGLVASDDGRPVHVAVPRGRRPRPAGVVVHRPVALPETDVRVREGRVTSVARTIADLAATASLAEVERLVADARVLRLVTDRELAEQAAGRPTLRALLDDGLRLTRSEAERRFLALVRRAGLPMPRTNVRVAGFEVDAFWPAARLVVEIDGFAAHGGRRAFERDRRRDQDLRAAGLTCLRITWRQLVDEPERLVALLARAT